MAASPAVSRMAGRMGRLGTETAFSVLARAEALKAEGREIINLGIGQPDFPTPDHVVEAAVRALRDGHHGYTPAPGIPALREAVAADLFRRHGVETERDRIVIVPGGKVTLFFAILMLGEPGAEILYPDPGFPIYESMIRFSGAAPVPVRLRETRAFAFDPEELLARVTPRTRLVIINSPGNPTGGVLPPATLERLSSGLAAYPGLYLLSDEIYGRILYGGHRHASMLAQPAIADRVILLDGWSKTYAMTGWRLGYGVWPQELVDGAVRLAINSHSCVGAATQIAGIAALEGPQDAVAAMCAKFGARRQVLVDGLNALPGVSARAPGGAFYAFPNITGTGMRAKEFQTRLLEEAGVATIAGSSFGRGGEGHLRFSYANSTKNIRRALARIARFLDGAADSDARAPTPAKVSPPGQTQG